MAQHRPASPVATLLLRRIDRHRHSAYGHRGTCRFTPSCSGYADDLLTTRRLPVALLLIAWRLLRCNPMANRVVADPAAGRRRWRPRPNAIPTFFAIVGLSGLVVVMTAAVAEAVGVSGGCSASINGHDPAGLTVDHPLVVHKGETVGASGTAPASAGVTKKSASNTHIDVSIIQGIADVSSSDHPGHGPNWSGEVNVDDYLKYGVGLYHVTGVASGEPGWHCAGDGYVELKDGSPFTKPIGAGATALTVIGGAGAALAARGSEPDVPAESPSEDPLAPAGGDGMDALAAGEASRVILKPRRGEDALAGFGCLILVALACFGALAADTSIKAGVAMAAPAARPGKRRVWSHGHPIVGFITGLIGGIGITVLLQQFAVWPLTIVTAIILPVVIAILSAVRAYLGRPYEVTEG